MMFPPHVAWMAVPQTSDPHVCLVYTRRDGSMFYGCTWLETDVKAPRDTCASYLVRIRMKEPAQ